MTTAWEDRSLLEDLVAYAEDVAWPGLPWVAQIVRDHGFEGEEGMTLVSFGLIAQVVIEGYMWPGTYVDGLGDLTPWTESKGDAVARIVEGWLEFGLEEMVEGTICFLENTDKGKELGRAVLRREGYDV